MLEIDILISSCGDRVKDLHRVFLPQEQGVRYLVGHQCSPGAEMHETFDREDVFYFPIHSTGVAKSRNLLLSKSESDVAYFCDDDVRLDDGVIATLRNSHEEFSDRVITYMVGDGEGGLRKRFKDSTVLRTRFSILSVGTIEVSVRDPSSFLVRFDEDLGAGAALPVGDEATFLAKVLSSGDLVRFVPRIVCYHPQESSGGAVSDASIVSRGVVLRRVFGFFVGGCILPLFFVRRKALFSSEKGRGRALYLLVKGFVRGGNYV